MSTASDGPGRRTAGPGATVRAPAPSVAGGATGPAPRTAGRAAWWYAFVVLVGLGLTWSLASPLYSVPDEPAHAVYAAAAVRGGLLQDSEGVATVVEVPADFAEAAVVPQCFAFAPDVPAGCSPAYGEPGDAEAEVVTTAGRYPPAYYLLAGLPSLVLDGVAAVHAMRGVTVLLTAALLASAFASALTRRRGAWPVLAALVATTPLVLFFAGAVNPQGPEIAAGVLLWSAGLALLGRDAPPGEDAGTATRLVLRVLVAAVVLSVARPISPLWLLLGAGVVLVVAARRDVLLPLLRRRLVLAGAAVVFLGAVSTAVWVLVADALRQQQVDTFADLPLGAAVLTSATKLDDGLRQMVGVFGWLDAHPPAFVHYGWFAVLGLLVLLALSVAGRRDVLGLGLLVAVGLVLPVVLEVSAYRESAFAWQGRYILPLLVGVPLVAGHVLERRGTPPAARLTAVVVVVLAACHLGAFVGVLNRYVHGSGSFWFLTPAGWDPPLGTAVLVLAHALLLAAAGVMVLRSARPAALTVRA